MSLRSRANGIMATSRFSTIEKLPLDLKRTLIDFLEPDDLYNFKMTSKRMRQTTEVARPLHQVQWIKFN